MRKQKPNRDAAQKNPASEIEMPPETEARKTPRNGRGAITNPTGRYERFQVTDFDDGWTRADEEASFLRTTVTIDATKSIIARNDSPDVGFDRSINPYRGCENGCVYCFARPTHAYLGLSPGLDFETRLFAKPRAAKLLEAELSRPGYRCKVMAMGTNTDPYQPLERRMRITRSILSVLARFRHPVGIVTKSDLVLRDRDILSEMAQRNLAEVTLSVTTLDRELARTMEPRAAAPERRLAAVRALREAGIPAGVLVAPVIPGINDSEIEKILAACRDAGAQWAGFVLLRLPLELKQLFEEWLRAHFPDRASHVLSLIREMRGGQLYQSEFGTRMSGTGPMAALIAQRFQRAHARLGFEGGAPLDTTLFRPPARRGETLPLFT